MTTSAYLNSIKSGAIECWHQFQVLPSLTGAQAALESGWGTSSLSKPPYNNNFGIKASTDWTGRTVTMATKEFQNGAYVSVRAAFRAYDSIADSVQDHGAFFTSTEWRRKNYAAVIGEKDYKKACYAVKAAGYATDPGYPAKLIAIIEKYGLHKWDQEAFSGVTSTVPSDTMPSSQSVPSLQPKAKKLGGDLTDSARAHVASKSGVSVIGDSLGVGTEPYLKALIPNSNYDVKGSRQITHSDPTLNGTTALINMKNAGTLKSTVVVILGTNRGLTSSEIDEFMRICGPERKVIWVETCSQVGHMLSVNSEIGKASMRHANAFAAKWHTYASSMFYEWYGSDKIHMGPVGYKKHAQFIAQAIFEAETGDFTTQSAESSKVEYEGIEGFKLYEDGRLEFQLTNPVTKQVETKVEQTDFRGLATDGKTNFIYNSAANKKWNPQNGNQEAEWLDGRYENSQLKGLSLIKAACSEMMQRAEPEAKYKVKLSQMPDNIAIGSEGLFIDHESKPPLYISARVIEIVTSECDPEANEVVIGNVTELTPTEKSNILLIQEKLQQAREDLINEWRKGEPLTVEIESTGSLVFNSEKSETQLIMRVFQGNYDVTEQFNDFRWERVSSDRTVDAPYNQVLSETQDSNTIIVTAKDVFGDESKFICRVYDDGGELIGNAAVSISIPSKTPGQSAYEAWLSLGNTGTVEDFIASLKGADGSDGTPGEPGKDGKPTYIHTAWADSPLGDNFTTSNPGSRAYVGFCVTNTPEDPTDYSQYEWQFVKGPKGEQGLQGLQGPQGDRGLEGPKGLDGKSSYTHIAYADSADGKTGFTVSESLNKAYIGMYVDNVATDSTDPTKYNWTLVKGADGKDGIPGPKGLDGKTPYLHIAYANSSDGKTDFSLEEVGNRIFIGTYTDFEESDSTDPTKYKWALIRQDIQEIGARNLLENSSFTKNLDKWTNNGATIGSVMGSNWGRIDGEIGKQKTLYYDLLGKVKANTTYTLIGTVRADYIEHGTTNPFTDFAYISGTKSDGSWSASHNVVIAENNKAEELRSGYPFRLKYTFTTHSYVESNKQLRLYIFMRDFTGIAWFKDFVLVEGTIAPTSYIPAPEDFQDQIDAKTDLIDFENVLKVLNEETAKLKALSTDMQITKNNALITHTDEIMTTITKLVGNANNADQQVKMIEQVISQVNTYFQFSDKLSIGKSDTKIKIEIDNEKMEFKDGETVMAWLSGNIFNAQNIKVNQGLSWLSHEAKTENDILVFRYVGG